MSAGLPESYARDKLPMLRRRWSGPEGEALRELGPRAWPDVPLCALMGLTASSMGMTEVVGDLSTSGSAMGLYGVEGPMRVQLASAPRVTELLGRVAYTDSRWATDYQGQTAVGLVNYQRHLALCSAQLPAALRPTEGGEYSLRVAAGAYSCGPGGTASVLSHYARDLEDSAELHRWAVLRSDVARDAPRVARIGAINARGPYGAAFLVVRVDQRLASGLELARAEREPTTWWSTDPFAGEDLVHLAYERPAASTSMSSDGGLVGFALSCALAWAAWRLSNRTGIETRFAQ